MNEIFLNEWRLYRREVGRVPFRGEEPRGGTDFDAPVKVGEVRVFADANRPLVALVLEDRGLSGYRLVPVSPFTVPASSRELLVGERVFQLWNATVAARRFVTRSWLVGTLEPVAVADIAARLPAAAPGRLTAGEDVQAKYEREFLIGGGTFIPFAEREQARFGRDWFVRASRIAASFLLVVGLGYLMLGGGGVKRVRDWRDRMTQVRVTEDYEVVELVEPEEPGVEWGSLAESATEVELPGLAASAPAMPVPVASAPRSAEAMDVMRTSALAGAVKLPEFQPAAEMPQTVLPLGFADGSRPAAEVAFSYAAAIKTVREAPAVEVRFAECPWNVRNRILNVRAPAADGVRVEVVFDRTMVESYRIVAGDGKRPLDVSYEVVTRPLASLGTVFCKVTTKWRSEDGEEAREETPVAVSAEAIKGLPPIVRGAGDPAKAVAPDDVPVDVRF